MANVYCSNCGTQGKLGANFCTSCGGALTSTARAQKKTPQRSSRVIDEEEDEIEVDASAFGIEELEVEVQPYQHHNRDNFGEIAGTGGTGFGSRPKPKGRRPSAQKVRQQFMDEAGPHKKGTSHTIGGN
jgi:hypothetical protein